MFAGLRQWIRRVLVVVILFIGAWLFFPFSPPTVPYNFEVVHGRTLKGVARDLNEQGLLVLPKLFFWLGRFCPDASRLQAGSYEIEGAVSPWDLFNLLFMGHANQHEVALIEGSTWADIRQALAEEEGLKHDIQGLSDADVLRQLHIDLPVPSEFLRAEGLFKPDTYFFAPGSTESSLLARAYALQQKDLLELWPKRDPGLPLKSPYDALILASIVERETAQRSERPLIAGVFVHRLELGMRLQTDPTVIYGLGSLYTGKLHHQDMIHDTPWNTYTRDGLPPTPIGLPSREALQAALHPSPTRALYFVARGDGSHYFSETLKAHEEAIDNFQKRLKKAR